LFAIKPSPSISVFARSLDTLLTYYINSRKIHTMAAFMQECISHREPTKKNTLVVDIHACKSTPFTHVVFLTTFKESVDEHSKRKYHHCHL
jgi:hypothetical protein